MCGNPLYFHLNFGVNLILLFKKIAKYHYSVSKHHLVIPIPIKTFSNIVCTFPPTPKAVSNNAIYKILF